MKYMNISLLVLFLSSCNEIQQQAIKHDIVDAPVNTNIIHQQGQTIATRFAPPKGFTRQEASTNSYTSFLRNIELKPHGTLVHLYNGSEKHNKVADAVLRFDVGKTDLQQCADAVMRIRSEYLFSQKKYDAIHFNFTNGFRADYKRWHNGERISVKGNTCSWVKKSKPDSSHETFRNYLDMVYSYAGSLSLSKELQPVDDLKSIEAGDVFIIGGSPGHAVTVMDIAVNKAGEKVFLLSQSYMPAQDIHLLKNLNNLDISPWYKVKDIKDVLETPEYNFEPNNLMRFKN
jgi:hypothetical protein